MDPTWSQPNPPYGPANGPFVYRLVDPTVSQSDRTYALFLHLTYFAWHIFIPLVPAIIMWQIKKKDSAFLDDHGREAVNFQLSLLAYGVLGLVTLPLCGLGGLVWAAAWVLGIVGSIMGAIAANRGEFYRYPACLRFL